jgi:hypothetical protein
MPPKDGERWSPNNPYQDNESTIHFSPDSPQLKMMRQRADAWEHLSPEEQQAHISNPRMDWNAPPSMQSTLESRNLSNAPTIGDILSVMQHRRVLYIPMSQLKGTLGPRIFKPQLESAQQQAKRIKAFPLP